MIKGLISSIVLSRRKKRRAQIKRDSAKKWNLMLNGKLAKVTNPDVKKEMHEKLYGRAQYLLNKYGIIIDGAGRKTHLARSYTMFQVLIFSTQRNTPFFDFPGEDSVRRFILREL